VWWCRQQFETLRHDTAHLLRLVEAVNSEGDLLDLTASAEAASETGRALAARQAEALDTVSQELLCSPEIIR
jgi:hypothetical protein